MENYAVVEEGGQYRMEATGKIIKGARESTSTQKTRVLTMSERHSSEVVPVLLLDEPFWALEPALRQERLTLVADVCQRQQLTLLMVSHSVEDAARIAPRSIVVAEGRIAWDGATDDLLSGNSSASALLGISAK